MWAKVLNWRSWLTTFLEYLLIGLVIALGICAVLFYKHGAKLETDVSNLQTRAAVLEGANAQTQQVLKEQRKAVSDLMELRERDGTLIQGLLDDYKRIMNSQQSTREKLAALERKDEQVKSILQSAPPASVRSVLEQSVAPAQLHRQDGAGVRQATTDAHR